MISLLQALEADSSFQDIQAANPWSFINKTIASSMPIKQDKVKSIHSIFPKLKKKQ